MERAICTLNDGGCACRGSERGWPRGRALWKASRVFEASLNAKPIGGLLQPASSGAGCPSRITGTDEAAGSWSAVAHSSGGSRSNPQAAARSTVRPAQLHSVREGLSLS
jgi:hypothetical protein